MLLGRTANDHAALAYCVGDKVCEVRLKGAKVASDDGGFTLRDQTRNNPLHRRIINLTKFCSSFPKRDGAGLGSAGRLWGKRNIRAHPISPSSSEQALTCSVLRAL